ncbi:MAG: hypothetical protein ABIP30_00240 [Ferruginibacter sp.]
MKVIQSQLTNYNYSSRVEKHIRLVRWWLLNTINGEEQAFPFNDHEEKIFLDYLDDHEANFPKEKREIFNSQNLDAPSLGKNDLPGDGEKPCLLLLRRNPVDLQGALCRRMDIILENDLLPIQLPFDVVGEILLESI